MKAKNYKSPLELMLQQEPTTKKSRRSEEYQTQKSFFQLCALNEKNIPELKWVYASMSGMYTDPRTAAMSKAAGLRRGIWDVHVPFARNGHSSLWIEFKSEKGKLSEEQIQFCNDCIFKQSAAEPSPLFLVYRDFLEAFEAVVWYLTGQSTTPQPDHVTQAIWRLCVEESTKV